MEFDEIKKIWNHQNQRFLYAFDEKALFKSIKAKKRATERMINRLEIMLSVINSSIATVILIDYLNGSEQGLWDLGLSLGIFLTVFFLLIFRVKRKKREQVFDRSMIGELDHAISNNNSVIHLSMLMLNGYFIPVLVFSFVKMIYFHAPIEKWLVILGGFALAFTLVIWERTFHHIPRKRKLEAIKSKLLADDPFT